LIDERIKKIEQSLNYEFRETKLIIEALTHRSCKKPYNNERLEFLGDAVLDLIVGEFLYNKLPKSNEGELSKIRASLVNESAFASLALKLNIDKVIILSNAEEKNSGRTKPSILSDAFEAIIGAIYLDVGFITTQKIVDKILIKNYTKFDLETLFRDYKTILQEVTQASFGVIPVYKVIDTKGPDHAKIFTIALFIDNKEYAKADGKSKKEAQQNCAKLALDKLDKVRK